MADGPAGFIRGFTCPALLGIRLGGCLLLSTGLLPAMAGLSRPLQLTNTFLTPCKTSHNPQCTRHWVWANPRSLAATDGITVVFSSSRYLDVSVPWVCLLSSYVFTTGYMAIKPCGFPHSEIPGSKPAYGSPRRIVVRYVLHRLLAPRHPPCALISLTYVVATCDGCRPAKRICFYYFFDKV